MSSTRVPPRRTVRQTTPPGRPAFQEPLIATPTKVTNPPPKEPPSDQLPAKAAKPPAPAPAPPSDRPTEHNGINVVREELRGNLPTGASFRISKLHLVDGTMAFACRDCLFTADTNVEVQYHRNAEHGAKFGKKTPKVVFPVDKDPVDLVLPPRGDKPAPTNPMAMTIAEILALAPSYAALADLIDRTEQERDAALAKVAEMKDDNREAQHAVAVYPSLQEEVVNLRLLVKDVGSYEQLKAELQTLRAFKKKVTQRLEAIGFVFTDLDSKE